MLLHKTCMAREPTLLASVMCGRKANKEILHFYVYTSLLMFSLFILQQKYFFKKKLITLYRF